MQPLFKSKLREKRWNALVEFFSNVKEMVESKNYIIMFDNELWESDSITIDVEEKDIYMSAYQEGNGKNVSMHQSFFRDAEYDCKKSADAIIKGILPRLKLFEKQSINLGVKNANSN
jgi:hypothetical protein